MKHKVSLDSRADAPGVVRVRPRVKLVRGRKLQRTLQKSFQNNLVSFGLVQLITNLQQNRLVNRNKRSIRHFQMLDIMFILFLT